MFLTLFNTSRATDVTYEVINPSKQIKDSKILLTVKNGKEPYRFYWSDKNTSLNSSIADNLTEGSEYTVLITDANGINVTKTIYIPTSSVDEKINSFFIPIVNFMEIILFGDPFTRLGIYDSTIYGKNNIPLKYPNGDVKRNTIPFIVIWLMFGAIFFTIRMKFVNLWGIKHAIDLIRGKYDNPKDKGEVSHFQALTTALSATVGLGNIAGVAIAISLGGPGATFWLILAGFLGMSSKFVECTLGLKYRIIDEHGTVHGGPMYYIRRSFEKTKFKKVGIILSFVFAFMMILGSFGGGNMFQANQAFVQVKTLIPALEGHGALFGFILSIFVGLVIIGGIKSIARVTDKMVPFMAGLYIISSLIIIFANIDKTGEAFRLIINGAFRPDSIYGGFVGVLIMGFRRAAFSNEAGVGSASVAHSAAKAEYPISEGLVALLEPFIDTVVICTMTALVLIFTGFYKNPGNLEGAELTSAAFASYSEWFPYLLVVAIFLFAFSTMISWSYYGDKAFNYLFGDFFYKYFGKRIYATRVYQVIFLLFVIVGCSSSLGAIVDFSDMSILSMAVPNILALLLLSNEVRADLIDYFKKLKSGEIKKYK